MIIAAALALELGANAPQFLKDCLRPPVEKMATPDDPQYSRMVHIKRLEVCAGSIAPLTSFAERAEPIAFTPLPKLPEEPIADAQEAPNPIGAESTMPPAASAFDQFGGGEGPFIATFGGLAPGANFTPVIYVAPIPEAQTWLLLAAGFGALAFRRKA